MAMGLSFGGLLKAGKKIKPNRLNGKAARLMSGDKSVLPEPKFSKNTDNIVPLPSGAKPNKKLPNNKLNEIKPTPTFTKKQPHHSAKEFRKQVDMQQDAINKMSVREWLNNKEAFDNMSDAQKKIHDKAAKKERADFRKKQINKMTKSIKRSNPNLSDKQAKQKAKEYLKGKDALHELDAVGGGYNKVVRMGDSGINRSIGSQWDNKGIADNIENQVREQIKNMGIKIPPNSNIPKDLMMNVKL
ncbi:polymorphic toxin type 15 domain-containing protein [Capnocytophaga canimorsus]|uniref:polymorphic toxin type 15 domain-containing protein n=1 Tax=Capnocytophaga canimorsus TaxID=28188 RepID=UPI001BB3056D|nr:polymorphic toxin type 15 domain-containing protein [Capnocytophaga canimorsus]